VRATAPSGSAEHVGKVAWSGELGFGVKPAEHEEEPEEPVVREDAEADHVDDHGGHH
jgi:hypothetical protein